MIKFSMLLKTSVLTKSIIRLLCDFLKYGEYYCEVISVIFSNTCSVRCYFLLLRIFIFGMNYMVAGVFFSRCDFDQYYYCNIYIHCVFVVCTFFALINIHCYLYTQSWADDVCWWFLWSIDVINRNRKRLNKK